MADMPAGIDWSSLRPVFDIIVGIGSAYATVSFRMGKYQERVDHLSTDKKEMAGKIDMLRTDVDRLSEFKISAQKFIDSQIYKAQSKLQLTEVGIDLVTHSGFIGIFEKEKSRLASLLAQKNPTSQYDVQEKARALLDTMSDYPPFAPIKTYAFTAGKDMGQILRAGGILLRDYYLQLHPEITT